MTIYVDEFFLKTGIMNMFILWTCGKMLRIKYQLKDLILASFCTTLLTFLLIINGFDKWFGTKIITCIFMAKIAYPSHSIKTIFASVEAILIITLFIGGIEKAYFQNIAERMFVALTGILALWYFLNKYKKRKWKSRNTYAIEFEIEKQKINIKAFLDTGNFLSYGIQEDPIMVVSLNSIKNQLPKDVYDKLVNIEAHCRELKKTYYITYTLADGTSREQFGFQIKDVRISNEQICIIQNMVLLITEQSFEGYDALIGLTALEGGWSIGDNMDVSTKSSEILC